MTTMPPIKALMTPFPHSVEFEERLEKAREMMARHGFRHLPVMREGRLVGVLSERDAQRAVELRGGPRRAQGLRVGDVTSREAYVVGLLEPADRVLAYMAREHVGSALVVKDGRLAGIFTTTDACRAFARFLRKIFPGGGEDAA